MTQDDAAPKPPANRLLTVDDLHRELFTLLGRTPSKTVTAEVCHRWALSLQLGVDAFDRVDQRKLLQSLMQYEGKRLTRRWVDVLARQLAARLNELRVSVIQLYDQPSRAEWLPLEIYTMRRVPWKADQAGQELQLYCLAGHPAGHLLPRKVPERWLSWLAYQIGFTRRLQYNEPTDLVGFRFWSYGVPAGDPPEFDLQSWATDSKMRQWNQSIIRLRRRLDIEAERIPDGKEGEYTCPFGYDTYCHECQKNALDCRASFHRGLS